MIKGDDLMEILALFIPILLIIGLVALIKGNFKTFRIKNRKTALIVLAVAIFVLPVIVSLGSSRVEELEEVSQETETQAEQEVEKTETKLMDYEIADVTSYDVADAKRYSYSVVISEKSTVDERENIVKDVVKKAKNDRSFNALSIYLYDYEEYIGDVYTLGKVDYAPNGEWGDAMEVDTGDYDEMEYSWDLRRKDWDKRLAPEEVKVWERTDELLYNSDMDQEEIFEKVAEEFEIVNNAAEVREVFDKKTTWSFMDLENN